MATDQLHKFSRTPHVAVLAASCVSRDDLVLSAADAEALLSQSHVTVEEKVDGSNLGISFVLPSAADKSQLQTDCNHAPGMGVLEVRLQKRGHWITPVSEPQFSKLAAWLSRHQAQLEHALGTQHILFGEWVAARHSVGYDKLPDYFLAFDVYDKQAAKYLSRHRRDAICAAAGVHVIRTLHTGPMPGGIVQLTQLLSNTPSAYITRPGGSMEGVYVRVDTSLAEDEAATLSVTPSSMGTTISSMKGAPDSVGTVTSSMAAVTSHMDVRQGTEAHSRAVASGSSRGKARTPAQQGQPAVTDVGAAPGRWLKIRAKLVAADFIQAIELHWSKRALELNTVRHDLWNDQPQEERHDDAADGDEAGQPQQDLRGSLHDDGGSIQQPAGTETTVSIPAVPHIANTQAAAQRTFIADNPATTGQSNTATSQRDSAMTFAAVPQAVGAHRVVGVRQGQPHAAGIPKACRLTLSHGVICLTGPAVDCVADSFLSSVPAEAAANRAAAFGPSYHITLLDPTETDQQLQSHIARITADASCPYTASEIRQAAVQALLQLLSQQLCLQAWVPLGLGQCSAVLPYSKAGSSSSSSTKQTAVAHYVVVAWPSAHELRQNLGLSRTQHFHITLGFNPCDVHSVSKDMSTLTMGSIVAAKIVTAAEDSAVSRTGDREQVAAGLDVLTQVVQQAAGLAIQCVTADPAPVAAVLLLHALTLDEQARTATGGDPMQLWMYSSCLVECALQIVAQYNELVHEVLLNATDATQQATQQGANLADHASLMPASEPAMQSVHPACGLPSLSHIGAAACTLLAKAEGREGDLVACAAHATAATCLDPSNAMAHLLLAKARFQQGQVLQALRSFETVGAAWEAQAQCIAAVTESMDGDASSVTQSNPVVALQAALFSMVDVSNAAQGSRACQKRLQQQQQNRHYEHSKHAESNQHGEDGVASNASAEAINNDSRQDVGAAYGGLSDELLLARQQTLLGVTAGPIEPRSRFTVKDVKVDGVLTDVQLMRNTSWLLPGQLMGSSTPRNRADICALAALGVSLVLTLTEETPLPPTWFSKTGISNVFVPVPNYEPPTVTQMDHILGLIEQHIRDEHSAVLVHCGGGKGRAGTVLACFMVKHGLQPLHDSSQQAEAAGNALPAEQAVHVLRILRPGSIETSQQERFVTTYSKLLWRRASEQEHQQGQQQQQQQQEEGQSSKPGKLAIKQVPSQEQGAGSDESGMQNEDQGGRSDIVADDVPASYPRTPHLWCSPQVADDDVQLPASATSALLAPTEVVITEKLDGGNCCVHAGSVYARGRAQQASHPSFNRVKALVAGWQSCPDTTVPPHLVLFGENMTAVHSIKYDGLQSPFYLIAVWDSRQRLWLSWADVQTWAERLSVPTVPVLWRGQLQSQEQLASLLREQAAQPSLAGLGAPREGCVVRAVSSIAQDQFDRLVAKYVRKGHVQTSSDWRRTWQPAVIPGPAAAATSAAAAAALAAASSTIFQTTAAAATTSMQRLGLPTPGKAVMAGSSAPCMSAMEQPSGSIVAPTAAKRTDVAARALNVAGGAASASDTEGVSSAAGSSQPAGASSLPSEPALGSSKQSRGRARTGIGTGSSSQATAGVLPRVLFLVGLPGSGKSTFADALVTSGRGWQRVCQDECGGSRRTCESEWARAVMHGGNSSRVILDRCNATVQDRADWMALALLSKRDKGIWAIHFDVSAVECEARVAARTNHPTIPFGRGQRAVQSFAKMLQAPTRTEGFERVYTVRTFAEANALLAQMGASPVALQADNAVGAQAVQSDGDSHVGITEE